MDPWRVEQASLQAVSEGSPSALADRRTRTRGAALGYRRLAIAIVLGDAVVVALGTILGIIVVSDSGPGRVWPLPLLAVAAMIGAFAVNGLYKIPKLAPAQEFRQIVSSLSVGIVLVGFLASIVQRANGRPGPRLQISVEWFFVTWLILLILLLAERKIWHRIIFRLRRSGRLAYRTVVLGATAEAVAIARRLSPAHGFQVVGFLETDTGPATAAGSDMKVLGVIDDLDRLVESEAIECLFVATQAVGHDAMSRLLQSARRGDIEVRVAANLPEILASRLSLQTIGGRLVFALDNAHLSGTQAVLKRSFDLLVAGTALVLTSPLWLTIAALVVATSRGPVFFRQRRLGRHGRPFTIYKFRTMVADAEVRKSELLVLSRGPLFKVRDDPRMTPVGRFLRRWSIDELPQLLNVLKRDMSLVGPRPLVMLDDGDETDRYLDRLEVLPGMTGLWQVSGRSDLTFEECVQLDTFYIENWSIASDVYILLRTIPAVLRKRGAY
jgi:exopolysaccharide biosynthesis polyprenyl glycosylphosphotransferase